MLATKRTDQWWIEPSLTAFGFLCFVIYTTWRALSGEYFVADNYLSPFYSPLLFESPAGHGAGHAWLGGWPQWIPSWIPESPAIFILIFPLSFRMTCYYYRKFYYDGFHALFRHGEFGIGVGTIILFINPTLLAFYAFGCHAFRHLIGGKEDCFTCPVGNEKIKYKAWKKVSLLNSKHMLWAWISMIWVALTDLYVMLVSKGVITDLNTWGN